MTTDLCASCGRFLSLHDRHVRFTLPDPVFALPEREQTPGTWLAGKTPRESDLMQVPGVGAFVRALLPIKLTEGHTLTYGVWVGVDPRELQSIFAVWWEPEFRDLRISGRLANAIAPWGLLAAPVETEVRNTGEAPYCFYSTDSLLDRVLHDEWPHELALTDTEER